MNGLTARQQQIFDLIRDHIQTTGYPPTRAEIAEHFGYRSVNAAEQHLKALEKKGMIEIVKGTSRGIRLMDDSTTDPGLPIVGDVAAGLGRDHDLSNQLREDFGALGILRCLLVSNVRPLTVTCHGYL